MKIDFSQFFTTKAFLLDRQSTIVDMNKIKSKTTGFTLVEILVVMVIIGILAAIGTGSFITSQQRSRDAQRKANLKTISSALELYYNDWGSYPLSDTSGRIVGCGDVETPAVCGWQEPFENSLGTMYMVELPGDPGGGKQFFYVSQDGSDFQIYTLLENMRDRDIPRDNDTNQEMIYPSTICTDSSHCNFGLASPNSTLEEPALEGEESETEEIPVP